MYFIEKQKLTKTPTLKEMEAVNLNLFLKNYAKKLFK